MKLFNLNDYKGGWIIGDFSPVLFSTTTVEVAIKSYSAGSHESRHVHNIATEYTIIIQGSVLMNNIKYDTGDIIQIDPKESTDFFAIEDTTTCVIKTPSIPSDKYLV